MHRMEYLVDAVEAQTEKFVSDLCEDIVGYRTSLDEVIGVPAGVLLHILGRLGAAEEALKDVIVRINNLEYS